MGLLRLVFLIFVFIQILTCMIVEMDYKVNESMNAANSADDTRETDFGDFGCNICFELVQSPIVTLCGHLYCWPCLYRWLQHHSHSHECPVCKAVIQEDKLVPIYGRGKGRSDSKSRHIVGLDIPDRPSGQNHFPRDVLDTAAAPRFGNLTMSALLGIISAIFTWHGVHDATVYGATTGNPLGFSSSFHGGYVHGFHHQAEGKQFLKIFVLLLGSFVLLRLIW